MSPTPQPLSSASSSASSPLATLRTLYPLAARAFIDRDFDATQTHVDTALAILEHAPPGDIALGGQRRKWDMLRVTLHTTIYSQPTSASARFKSIVQQPPHSLVADMHARSVRFFAPPADKPSPVYLPPSVVVNLVLAALRLDCLLDARAIAEEWLALQQYDSLDPEAAREYEKVVQVYCLHVLPRLDDWDLAQDHLLSNHMLTADSRRHLLKTLKTQRAAAQHAHAHPPSPRPSSAASSSSLSDRTATPSRLQSPTPSTSSASTTSTRTARPTASTSAAARLAVTSLVDHAASSASPRLPSTPSASSLVTITPRSLARTTRKSPDASSSVSRSASASASASTASTARGPRGLSLSDYLTFIRPYLARFASSNVALFVIFLLVPVLAGILRLRMRRRKAPASPLPLPLPSARELVNVFPATADPAQVARERLKGVGSAWWRAMVDTVRMASGGLA